MMTKTVVWVFYPTPEEDKHERLNGERDGEVRLRGLSESAPTAHPGWKQTRTLIDLP